MSRSTASDGLRGETPLDDYTSGELKAGRGVTDSPERVNLKTVITAHPKRLAAAERLRDTCPSLRAEIVLDPDPEAAPSALRSAAIAWSRADEAEATHHLVLQDDAIMCDDFHRAVIEAVRSRPYSACSLFAHWSSHQGYAGRLAALCGYDWAPVIGDYVPTVALVLPVRVASALGRYLTQRTRRLDLLDDVEIWFFLADFGIDTVLSVPSLVDHDDGVSLVGNDGTGPRRAACFMPTVKSGRTPECLAPRGQPYMSCEKLRAEWCSRGYGPHSTDDHVPAWRYLSSMGMTPSYCFNRMTHSIKATHEGDAVADAVGLGPLYEVWQMAMMFGVAVAGEGPAGQGPRTDFAESILRDPASRAAVDSLGPGILRTIIPGATLEACAQPIGSIMRDAIGIGVAEARQRLPRSRTLGDE